MGAPGCGLRVGSAWLGHEALLGAEVSEENPQWRCLDPLQEEKDGVHWACLVVPGAGGADFVVFLPWEKLDAASARLCWLVTAAPGFVVFV
jgi:hypothetical protein